MYSRNTWEKRQGHGYTLPPGYDGNRFRRRRRYEKNGADDEVILVPDSVFAPENGTDSDTNTLSVGGIPTQKGLRSGSANKANAENSDIPHHYHSEDETAVEAESYHSEKTSHNEEKLSGILSKLGFMGGMTSDELLICAIIFIIASDKENGGRNSGDILLILALLLGIR
ncbi:MAG: hypothetical protein E7578_06245 [Ruminococcaceae bacterium]|nr:hypothetical protein [Oscillospiraceae bacterium]